MIPGFPYEQIITLFDCPFLGIEKESSSPVGDNFKEWFLDKVEQPMGESTLNYGKLSHSSVDGPIIEELGGKEKAETTLTELFALMEMQRDGDGKSGGGWYVSAYPVTDPYAWDGEYRVFSRDSRLPLAA